MDKTELQCLYDEAGSISEMARRLGVKIGTMRYRLIKAGIEIRGTGYTSPRTVEMKRGEEHHNWKGGTYVHEGYVMQYAPEHPDAAKYKGYVLQHRLVMERELGRFLKPDEDVHHDDENRANNVPSNLVLTKRGPHLSHHAKKKPRTRRGTFA